MAVTRTQPRNNTRPSGVPQGTPGGQTRAAGKGATMMAAGQMGPTTYLWILVAIEVLLMSYFRSATRRYHGG